MSSTPARRRDWRVRACSAARRAHAMVWCANGATRAAASLRRAGAVVRALPVASAAAGAALLICAATSAAQPANVHVARFTVDDGLAENNVTALTQDSVGYMWVGTPRGVQRFDGYSFTPLASLDAQLPPAARGRIGRLQTDARGRLWIATDTTLLWGYAGREPLQRMRGGATVAPDSAGRLWLLVRNDRLGYIDWNSESPRLDTIPIDTVPPCCTRIATTRDQQAVWAVPTASLPGQVFRIDVASGAARTYRLPGVSLVAAVLEAADGRIWAGGIGGVVVLDRGADEFRALGEFRNLEVGDIQLDGRGDLLVSTDRFLARANPSGHIVQRWAPLAAYGAGPLLSSALFVDREAGIWLGTLAAGLVRIDPTPPVFSHIAFAGQASGVTSDFVMALHEARDGTLHVGTLGGGAFALSTNGNGGPWRLLTARTGSSTSTVWDFAEDDDGRVWTATTTSLCAQRDACMRARESHKFSFADVTRAADGWLWAARGEGGLASFQPSSRSEGVRVETGWTLVAFADSVTGTLWVGGDLLRRARVANGQLLDSLETVPADVGPGASIFDIRRDSRGIIWLASHRGLQRWDSTTQRFAPIDVAELRGKTVFSLAEDAGGRLWLGTSHGLVQYSPVNNVARRYGRQDGVLSGEFNRRAALRLRNGTMVFGGLHGLTVFDPERVNAPRPAAPMVFTRWQKATREGTVEGQVSSDVAHDDVALELRPGERAFTIEFASLTFAAGPARRYRYRLEGLSSEWIETSDHAVTYGAPGPGRYTFQVQASAGSEGAWSEPGASLPLRVIPPVWATTWFRVLFVALVLSALWSLHRLRLRQAVATERLRLRISRDLHDEIGAGLSSIALLSDAVGVTSADARERTQLQRISRSARNMVADLRDIVWAIDPEGDRLHDVVSRMKDVAADLLPGTRVDFHEPADADLAERIGMAARRDLLLIYKELLHNIVRHASASVVEIQLSTRRDIVVLEVADDGRGFDPSVVRAGTGLKSMRERAARIGGRIEFANRESGGTRVRLTLKRT